MRREHLSTADLEAKVSLAEEEIIKNEILPVLKQNIEPALQPVKRELVLVVDYVPGKPLSVHLSRTRNFAAEIPDAKEIVIDPEVTHSKHSRIETQNQRGPATDLSVRFTDGVIIAEKKAWLLRTVKNAVKNTAGYIERKFDNRYDKLLNEKENDTKNKLVALKLRAWGSDIGDIAGRQCLTQRQSRSDVLLSQSNDTQSLSKRHHQVKSIKIENKYMSPINIRKTNTQLLLKTASSFTNPNHFNHTKSILFSSLTERGHSKQRTVNTFASTIASPIKPIKFAKLRSISSSKEKKESKEKSSIETMISSKVFLLGCDFNNRYKQNLCKFGY